MLIRLGSFLSKKKEEIHKSRSSFHLRMTALLLSRVGKGRKRTFNKLNKYACMIRSAPLTGMRNL